MKCNQNHPNKQVISKNLTGKPLPFGRQIYPYGSKKKRIGPYFISWVDILSWVCGQLKFHSASPWPLHFPQAGWREPRSQRQSSVHFNTEPVLWSNSTQPTLTNKQNIQMTPQQLVNLARQPNSQNNQLTTNAPTPYNLQAASTVFCRNTQIIYPYLAGSVPMQQFKTIWWYWSYL